MLPKRFLVAAIVFFAGAFVSSGAQAGCFQVQTPLTFSYKTGSISISYQDCTTMSNTMPPTITASYWKAQMNYTNVSYDGSFTINGSMSMQLNFSGATMNFESIVFNGGPLTFDVGGKAYTVMFNNLSYSLNNAFQVGNPQGTLTINNVLYPADPQYFAYLFQ